MVENAEARLIVPVRVEAEGLVADALLSIGPEHPDYEAWRTYFEDHPEEQAEYETAAGLRADEE